MNPPTRLPTILFLSFIAALTTAQADLVQAWAYVAAYPAEIEQALRQQEEA